MSLVKFPERLLFLKKNLTPDLGRVVQHDASFEVLSHVWILIKNPYPVNFTDWEAGYIGLGMINEFCLLVEGGSIGANYWLVLKADAELFDFVNFVADVNCALVKEHDFIELLKLINDCGPNFLMSRFKVR